MTARGIIVRIGAVLMFIALGVVAGLAFFRTGGTGGNEVNEIQVKVNAKTCGEGNAEACDRICQNLKDRLIITSPLVKDPLDVRCRPLKTAEGSDINDLLDEADGQSSTQTDGDSTNPSTGSPSNPGDSDEPTQTGPEGPQGPQGEPGQPDLPGQGNGGQGIGVNVCINNPLLPACAGININQGAKP